MGINLQQIRNVFVDWIKIAVDLNTIWDNQNGIELEYPYCLLEIIDLPRPLNNTSWISLQDYDSNRSSGNELRLIRQSHAELTLRVMICSPGNNTYDLTTRLLESIHLTEIKDLFNKCNISANRVIAVKKIPIIHGFAQVNRFYFDVIFNCVMDATEFTGYIEKIRVIGEAFGIDQDVTGA